MLMYGVHSCRGAVLAGKRNVLRVYILQEAEIPHWMRDICPSKISRINVSNFKKMVPPQAVHQGVAIEVEDIRYGDISAFANVAQNCVVAILDGVTDPRNLGATIRTAAAFGINNIVLTEKSSCKVSGVVAKAASGGLEHVTICLTKNLSQAIDQLKLYGFWVVSLCEGGTQFLHEIKLNGKVCLILGAEGKGIRRLPKEKSDFVAKLPTKSSFSTLNVSASAALAFYEVARQNKFSL
jgi:23S rRNA (guanosine2251-2'-O)-methyltransferase